MWRQIAGNRLNYITENNWGHEEKPEGGNAGYNMKVYGFTYRQDQFPPLQADHMLQMYASYDSNCFKKTLPSVVSKT